MVERANVLQRTQIGVESVAGTAVAATKRLGGLSIALQPAGNIQNFGPMGSKFDTIAALGREWATLNGQGYASYLDMPYLLGGLIRYAAPAQQGGSTAYLWTATPQASAEDATKTFTVEQGEVSSGGRATRVTYGQFMGAKWTWNRDGVNVNVQGIARRIEDDVPLSTSATYTLTAAGSPPTTGTYTLTHGGNTTTAIAHNATAAAVQAALEALASIGANNVEVEATTAAGAGDLTVAANVYTVTFKRALAAQPITLTGTFTGLTPSGSIAIAAGTVGAGPTLLTPVPILGNQVSVYMDASQASIGTTKLTRVFSGEIGYENRFGPVWPVDAANASFAAMVELKPSATFSMKMAADDVGMGLLTTMRAGDTKYIRWNAEGDIIASTYPYRLRFDMACKIKEVFKYEDLEGIYAVGFTFSMVEDADMAPFVASCQTTNTTL